MAFCARVAVFVGFCFCASTGSGGRIVRDVTPILGPIGYRREAIIQEKIEEMSNDPELSAALTYPHFESKTVFPSNNPKMKELCWDKCPAGKHINMKERLMQEAKKRKSPEDDADEMVVANRRDVIIKQKIQEMSKDPELRAAMTYPHFESKTIFPSNHPEWADLCWEKCPEGKNYVNMKERMSHTRPRGRKVLGELGEEPTKVPFGRRREPTGPTKKTPWMPYVTLTRKNTTDSEETGLEELKDSDDHGTLYSIEGTVVIREPEKTKLPGN